MNLTEQMEEQMAEQAREIGRLREMLAAAKVARVRVEALEGCGLDVTVTAIGVEEKQFCVTAAGAIEAIAQAIARAFFDGEPNVRLEQITDIVSGEVLAVFEHGDLTLTEEGGK